MALVLVSIGASALARGDLPAPLTDDDFLPVDAGKAELGRLLFYDPVLSGNRNIACATCHHPRFGTGDAVSLPIGEGGMGLGPERVVSAGANVPERRVARNSPPLFNLGATEMAVLFHDGRLEHGGPLSTAFRSPLGEDMVDGFDGMLAAQAMFPVIAPDEMAGHYGENEVASAVRKGIIVGPDGAWALITARVAAIPEYVEQFESTFGVDGPDAIRFVDIANAIAAFIAFEWRASDSPFDRYLRGDMSALDVGARRGLALFYGSAGCAACHSGSLLTDHGFHAIGMPQFGPGRVARFESRPVDLGRMRVTGRRSDAYRFRTPGLRNVEHTAPYGHDGAYPTLEGIIRHHLDPEASLRGYDRADAGLPAFPAAEALDWVTMDDVAEVRRIAAAVDIHSAPLTSAEIADLVAFLRSLSDEVSLEGRLGVPIRVPSGLPVE